MDMSDSDSDSEYHMPSAMPLLTGPYVPLGDLSDDLSDAGTEYEVLDEYMDPDLQPSRRPEPEKKVEITVHRPQDGGDHVKSKVGLGIFSVGAGPEVFSVDGCEPEGDGGEDAEVDISDDDEVSANSSPIEVAGNQQAETVMTTLTVPVGVGGTQDSSEESVHEDDEFLRKLCELWKAEQETLSPEAVDPKGTVVDVHGDASVGQGKTDIWEWDFPTLCEEADRDGSPETARKPAGQEEQVSWAETETDSSRTAAYRDGDEKKSKGVMHWAKKRAGEAYEKVVGGGKGKDEDADEVGRVWMELVELLQ